MRGNGARGGRESSRGVRGGYRTRGVRSRRIGAHHPAVGGEGGAGEAEEDAVSDDRRSIDPAGDNDGQSGRCRSIALDGGWVRRERNSVVSLCLSDGARPRGVVSASVAVIVHWPPAPDGVVDAV